MKPYYADMYRDKFIDPILEKWHKTAAVSDTIFCVDDKRDAKSTCNVENLNNDNQEIGKVRYFTTRLNPHITKVDGSVFYHPSDPISSNPCDLGEFHMNTQTKSTSFTSRQIPTTITATPTNQNYVLHQTIPCGLYTKNLPIEIFKSNLTV